MMGGYNALRALCLLDFQQKTIKTHILSNFCQFAVNMPQLLQFCLLQIELFIVYYICKLYVKMPDSLFAKKLKLLEEFLNLSLFDRFSNLTLQKAGLNIGLDKGQVAILAPDGTLRMVDYWFSLADEFMAQEISKRSGLKIREKATIAIRSRNAASV